MAGPFRHYYRDHDPDRPDPYPVCDPNRVDRPTTQINAAAAQRRDEGNGGFPRAGRAESRPNVETAGCTEEPTGL